MSPTPIDDANIVGEREKFLLYGDPKMGKTFTALTLPEPIYFLAIGGPNEAKTYYSKQFQKRFGKKEIYIDVATEDFDVTTQLDKATGADNVRMLIEKAFELDDKGEMQFQSVIIDNATVLSEFMMNRAIEVSGYTPDGKEKDISTIQRFREKGILTPADNDWNAEMSMMTKFMSQLFRQDKHLCFIAHEYEAVKRERATGREEVLGIKPLFVGKNRDRIANKFDNVWRMTHNKPYYVARTVPGEQPTIIAGSRLGGIIDEDYMNPDLSYVIKEFKKYAAGLKK